MTKQELQEYYWLKRNIERLENKLIELETEATKQTTRLSDEPKGGEYSHDKLSGLVAKIVEVQEQINGELEKSYELLSKIEKAIEILPEEEKYLIRARYIDRKKWEHICFEVGYSWRQTHRLHARALKMLA